jgi:hypothetical protein
MDEVWCVSFLHLISFIFICFQFMLCGSLQRFDLPLKAIVREWNSSFQSLEFLTIIGGEILGLVPLEKPLLLFGMVQKDTPMINMFHILSFSLAFTLVVW